MSPGSHPAPAPSRGATPRLKAKIRRRGREILRSLFLLPRLPLGFLGQCALPSFVVIGAQKAGTTSLFRYLSAHPAVVPPRMKEIHYFDLHFRKGPAWYRAHFPFSLPGGAPYTGEASPYYLFHPRVPERMNALLPHARLLVLLRNPVDRAISQYHWEVRYGNERLSFREAMAREKRELPGEEARLRQEDDYVSFLHQHGSYLARGRYAEQLERWLAWYPRNRILALKAEEFFRRTGEAMRSVHAFLDLPPDEPRSFPVHRQGRYEGGVNVDRKELAAYFRPHNEALGRLLGMDFRDWA